MIREAIYKLMQKEDLTREEARAVMEEMATGEATQAQMGSFLTALRLKGETIEEITAFAEVMREKGTKVHTDRPVMEIVGTGGDEVGTFNISTTAAFVIAAGGVPVAKHGNRSVSSKSGAADVLENLGAKLDLTPEQNEKVLRECDICFLFAQTYHSSMKYAAPVRREIGIRTVYNILGPLCNPAGAQMQLLGVYDRNLAKPLAQVLSNLGVVRGAAVWGDGLDEITMTGPTEVHEISDGQIKSYTITPEQFGMQTAPLADLIGGTPQENAQMTREILQGKLEGPKSDIVALNAGMSLYLAGKAPSAEDGVKLAQEILKSGKAYEKLETFIKLTNEADS